MSIATAFPNATQPFFWSTPSFPNLAPTSSPKSHGYRQIVSFTSQKIIATTTKPFTSVIADLERSANDVPLVANGLLKQAAVSEDLKTSGSNLSPSLVFLQRRKLSYDLDALLSSSPSYPFRLSIVEGAQGVGTEIQYDLASAAISSGIADRDFDQERAAIELDKKMAVLVREIAGGDCVV